MYKLIALDCDGTLLNSKKEITHRTILAIQTANTSGLRIVLASARPFYRLKPYIEKLGLMGSNQYTIAFNGGLITNNTATDTLFSGNFDPEKVRELVDLGLSFGTTIFLYTEDGILSNNNDTKYRMKNPDVKFIVADLMGLDFSKIRIFKIAYVNSPEKTSILRTNLPNGLNEKYEISSSVPQFVAFVCKGITKSKALMRIGEKIGIRSDEMVAFGDQDNDIPMLKYVGLSIAMGNASPDVKQHSRITTSTNDEDGVAIAIEELLTNDNK